MTSRSRQSAASAGAGPSGTSEWQDAGAAIPAEARPFEAIDLLMEANRARRDGTVEQELVRLRHEAFGVLDRSGPAASPPAAQQSAPIATVPPMVSPSELTAEVLRSGILLHGSLLVRRAVAEARVRELVDGIDHAFTDAENHLSRKERGESSPWFEPFRANDSYPRVMHRKLGQARKWVRMADGVWGADSPRMLFNLLDTFDEAGLSTVITEYLGERPAMTVDKCTLRRVGAGASTDWHQDGSFLGSGIRTVNVWLCLSACGRDAPGLDIVPARLDRILETGTEGAIFDWAVGPGVVERVSASTPVVRPDFEPGDVLFFDDLLLHRTATEPSMTRQRYAIETWFFAPSAYPEQYVPLVA
jgi:hypothetical protein